MWKCKNCGGDIFEHSIARVDRNWNKEEYIKLVYECESCDVNGDSDMLENIAEWVD